MLTKTQLLGILSAISSLLFGGTLFAFCIFSYSPPSLISNTGMEVNGIKVESIFGKPEDPAEVDAWRTIRDDARNLRQELDDKW